MHIAQRHAAAEILIAEILVRVVDAIIAVEFVDHVVELGEHKAAHPVVQAEFVQHVMVLPGEIAVARGALDAPDHAAFAVHQRRVGLLIAADKVKLRARIRAVNDLPDVIAQNFEAV